MEGFFFNGRSNFFRGSRELKLVVEMGKERRVSNTKKLSIDLHWTRTTTQQDSWASLLTGNTLKQRVTQTVTSTYIFTRTYGIMKKLGKTYRTAKFLRCIIFDRFFESDFVDLHRRQDVRGPSIPVLHRDLSSMYTNIFTRSYKRTYAYLCIEERMMYSVCTVHDRNIPFSLGSFDRPASTVIFVKVFFHPPLSSVTRY